MRVIGTRSVSYTVKQLLYRSGGELSVDVKMHENCPAPIKQTMPRPELYPVKKVIGFNREQLSAIDRWRRSQSPIPTVSDAIRQLVEQSLAATKSARRSREEMSGKAAELAAQVIEKKTDKSQPVEEQKARKRKLISGPSEFRDVRRDQPKQKSQQRRT